MSKELWRLREECKPAVRRRGCQVEGAAQRGVPGPRPGEGVSVGRGQQSAESEHPHGRGLAWMDRTPAG